MKWSCLDKVVFAIFIQEIILGVLSLFFLLGLGHLMVYPILLQTAKAVIIGICLFGWREKPCGRWTAAITLAVVQVLDVVYFLFWFMVLGVIF